MGHILGSFGKTGTLIMGNHVCNITKCLFYSSESTSMFHTAKSVNYEIRLNSYHSLDKSKRCPGWQIFDTTLEELELDKKANIIRVTRWRYVNGSHNHFLLPKSSLLNFSSLTERSITLMEGCVQIRKHSSAPREPEIEAVVPSPEPLSTTESKHGNLLCCKGGLHKSRLSVSHHDTPLIGSEVETWRTPQAD